MTEEKKESKTRIGEKVKLPSGFWEIIKETPEGVTLVNKKGHRQAFTLKQLTQFEKKNPDIRTKIKKEIWGR